MKKYTDAHRRDPVKNKPGDKVLLSAENIRTTRPKVKWSDKRLGPYTVIKEVYPNSDSYKLKLARYEDTPCLSYESSSTISSQQVSKQS